MAHHALEQLPGPMSGDPAPWNRAADLGPEQNPPPHCAWAEFLNHCSKIGRKLKEEDIKSQ